jgi:hypothetical protein
MPTWSAKDDDAVHKDTEVLGVNEVGTHAQQSGQLTDQAGPAAELVASNDSSSREVAPRSKVQHALQEDVDR